MSALLFGSISTLADTSEVQRRAFNQAFATHGLDWEWSREDYASMLGSNGGADRIAEFARKNGTDVDAKAVHATKTDAFHTLLADADITPRPGVVDTIAAARNDGISVALVTTTSRDNIDALLSALSPAVSADSFDLVVDKTQVDAVKPDPASYRFALERLDESASSAVAVEDNVGGVAAAHDAGIRTIAFPNENTVDGDFSAADEKVDALDPAHVGELLSGGQS